MRDLFVLQFNISAKMIETLKLPANRIRQPSYQQRTIKQDNKILNCPIKQPKNINFSLSRCRRLIWQCFISSFCVGWNKTVYQKPYYIVGAKFSSNDASQFESFKIERLDHLLLVRLSVAQLFSIRQCWAENMIAWRVMDAYLFVRETQRRQQPSREFTRSQRCRPASEEI